MKYQGQLAQVAIRLFDTLGVPVTGVLYSAVTAKIWKAGTLGFVPKTLASADWLELGYGIYIINFSPTDMNTLSTFAYYLTGAGFVPYWNTFDVTPAPLSLLANTPLCVVTGNVVDLGGQSFSDQNQNLVISFRIANVPQSVGGTSIVSSKLLTTTTDAFGNFSVAILQGAVVIVEIAPLGLRQKITIPATTSATLLSLLPPF